MSHRARAPRVAHRCEDITNRLTTAADSLLFAIRSPQGFDSVMSLYGGSLRSGRRPPPGVYTTDEIVEAMSFLIRLGLVPAAKVVGRPRISLRDDVGGGRAVTGRSASSPVAARDQFRSWTSQTSQHPRVLAHTSGESSMANGTAVSDTGFRHDVQGLGEGLNAIKSDVATLARGAADTARSGASEIRRGAGHAVDVAKEKFGEAKDMARDKYEDAKESATDAAESLKSVIERNPIASIGIAAGVGLLIGLVVMRPRS